MKTTNPKFYRQGDVLLRGPIQRPENLRALPVTAASRAILALGEATGHHHSFSPGAATLYAPEENAVECTHVEIAEAMALLEHQEHDSIALAPGCYEVIRQREYAPEAIRRVAD